MIDAGPRRRRVEEGVLEAAVVAHALTGDRALIAVELLQTGAVAVAGGDAAVAHRHRHVGHGDVAGGLAGAVAAHVAAGAGGRAAHALAAGAGLAVHADVAAGAAVAEIVHDVGAAAHRAAGLRHRARRARRQAAALAAHAHG